MRRWLDGDKSLFCVDLKATFTIHTSKTGAQLIIPLPHQAISLFRIMQKLSSSQQYIFTGMLGHLPLHEHTLNKQSNIINNLILDQLIGDNGLLPYGKKFVI
jgi:hypothetical protein